MRSDFKQHLWDLEVDYGKGLTIEQAFDLTGKRSDANLLRSLSFWQSKAATKRSGRIWIIKTASEIREDGFLYSDRTIGRTLKSLVMKDMLLLEHHPHPYRGGILNASWISISDKVCKFLLEVRLEEKKLKKAEEAELDEAAKMYGYTKSSWPN